jgi:hypothetical protein
MKSSEKNHLILKICVAIAVAAIFVFTALLFQQYERIQRLGYFNQHRSIFQSLRGSGPLNPDDVGMLDTWMTFDYVNHGFLLPENYLQTSLGVTDSRYPRLTIAEYAADVGVPSDAALAHVESAITLYFEDFAPKP